MPECINTNSQTVQIFSNNQGAIALIKNPYITKRLKYIDVYYYFIRDLAKRERLEITYILTNRIVTNRITKPLAYIVFKRFKNQIGIVNKGQIYKQEEVIGLTLRGSIKSLAQVGYRVATK